MGEAANPNGPEGVNLFSKMDLAKRGAEVIARSLGANDTLTMVGFSSAVTKVLPRVSMDPAGLDRALEALGTLRPCGGTALWDGLYAGLYEMEVEGAAQGVPRNDRLAVVVMLTDGVPSESPPNGEVEELRKYIGGRDNAIAGGKPRTVAKVVTMGFGYDVNSKLLLDLATAHAPSGNDFLFIPDGTMLLTTFVNLMSNLLTTCGRGMQLRIKPSAAATAAAAASAPAQAGAGGSDAAAAPAVDLAVAMDAAFTTPGAPAAGAAAAPTTLVDLPTLVSVAGDVPHLPLATPVAIGLSLQLGDVRYGQPKQVVLRPLAGEGTGPLPDWRGWQLLLRYVPTTAGTGNGPAEVDGLAQPPFKDVPAVTKQVHRSLCVSAITQAARVASVDLATAQKVVKEVALSTMQAPGLEPHPVLEDLLGEVSQAVGSKEAYDRWGSHYLRALASAHRAQTCTNFKDPGLLAYGGHATRDRRDALNTMCDSLPVPTPSIMPRGTAWGMPAAAAPVTIGATQFRDAFNNMNGGCIAHGSRVLLADGVTTKAVESLRAADEVYVPGCGGAPATTARVVCVVESTGVKALRLPGLQLLITPWHPIRLAGRWQFPADVAAHDAAGRPGATPQALAASMVVPPSVYNLVLDGGHVVVADGVECVTLAHGFQEDVVRHYFYGTEAVLRALQAMQGWAGGHVLLGNSGAPVVDAASGRMVGFAPADGSGSAGCSSGQRDDSCSFSSRWHQQFGAVGTIVREVQ